ncbi:MAG: Ig-like domain-containing protein [Thermoplasmatales archaeon]|nr:Ig-like domain-containing protein [Thermoplasmatales archaeon]
MKKWVFIPAILLLILFGCLGEKNPPVVEIKIDGKQGEAGWFISDVRLSINAYDNESGIKEIKYRINGEQWREYVGIPYSINQDGYYLVEYIAVDGKNNEARGNLTIKIDRTKPSINFENFEKGYIYFRGKKILTPRIPHDTMIIGGYNIIASSNDSTSGVKKVEFYMGENLALEKYEPPYEWEINRGIGVYNITAIAYDNAGNKNEIMVEEVQLINIFGR